MSGKKQYEDVVRWGDVLSHHLVSILENGDKYRTIKEWSHFAGSLALKINGRTLSMSRWSVQPNSVGFSKLQAVYPGRPVEISLEMRKLRPTEFHWHFHNIYLSHMSEPTFQMCNCCLTEFTMTHSEVMQEMHQNRALGIRSGAWDNAVP